MSEKFMTLRAGVAALALTVLMTPALAASPEIEDFCWDQASQQRFSGRGEREAFIANCIANLTPSPTKGRKYRRNY